MNAQRRFVRKMSYLGAIAVLLLVLPFLSQPGSNRDDASQGGKLARMRAEHRLSQADLGNVDPTSATMRFATFGLHGLAANRLWVKAHDAKARENWTDFDAVLEQIANFQPNFVEVWKYQAWNVAYNLPVRFDDYRDRYDYVIRGLKFLERGIGYNDRATTLPRDLAWMIGHKIGQSDERRAFRRLFMEDDEYHEPSPDNDWLAGTAYKDLRQRDIRDCWKLRYWWYRRIEERFDNGKLDKPRHSEALFYQDAPHSLIEYALALVEEGKFGDEAKRAWTAAAEAWEKYGDRPIKMSYGYRMRLLDFDVYRRQAVELLDELHELEPTWRPQLLKDRKPAATEEQLALLEKPWQDCDRNERTKKYDFMIRLYANPRVLLDDLDEERRAQVLPVMDRYDLTLDRVQMIRNSRELVAYESWQVRCEVERQTKTIEARKALYEGDAAMRKAQLSKALEYYEEGLALWKEVLDEYPVLLEDWSMTDDLVDVIDNYREILAQNDQPFPEPFVLQMVLDKQESP